MEEKNGPTKEPFRPPQEPIVPTDQDRIAALEAQLSAAMNENITLRTHISALARKLRG